jgi:peptidoglycan/LPS O-acetylase OafA/YrhL
MDKPKPITKIQNLQALRVFAALPVVFYHTGFSLGSIKPVGIFGIHLFFLLSGYIMASIIDNDSTAFLRRRLIRIIPLYWSLTLLLYLVAWRYPHLMGATKARPVELFKSLFFVPFAKSNGLFQPILFVGWTVNYEMFFYMTLSLAVLINRRRAALIGAAIMLSIMGFCSFFAGTSPIARFYSDPLPLECIFGLIAYYCVRYATPRLTPAMKPLLLSLAFGCLILLPVMEEFGWFGHVPEVLRYGPLCFILISSACLLTFSGVDIKIKAIVLLGDASYVMYLVHPYIEEFLDRVIGWFWPVFRINSLIGCLVALLLVPPISMLLYVTFDRPSLRYLNRVLCGRRRSDPAIAMRPSAFELAGQAKEGVVGHPAVVRESTLA